MNKYQLVPFEKAFFSVSCGNKKLKESEYLSYGKFPVIDQGKNLIAGYSDNEELIQSDFPYIIFGDHTKIVKYVDFPFIVGADGVRIFQASKDFDSEYLYFFLRNVKLPNDGYGRHSKHLNKVFIPSIEINHQSGIVTQLKERLAEVEKAKKAVEILENEVKALINRQKTTVSNWLQSFKRVKLGYLIDKIEAGKSIQTTEKIARPEQLGVLKVSAISWNKFLPEEAKSVEESYTPPKSHRVKKGDFIISRANTVELVGAVVVVENDYPNRLLSDKTLRLHLKEELVDPRYLLYILRLPESRGFIEENATGTSDSMRNISQSTIRNIPVPFAPRHIQNEVVHFFDQSNEQINTIQTALDKTRKDLVVLTEKIISQAFDIN